MNNYICVDTNVDTRIEDSNKIIFRVPAGSIVESLRGMADHNLVFKVTNGTLGNPLPHGLIRLCSLGKQCTDNFITLYGTKKAESEIPPPHLDQSKIRFFP